jgi:hypothetical protein
MFSRSWRIKIQRLKSRQAAIEPIREETERLEAKCRNVPEGPRLERLLRYEASIECSFDRTLNQLERLQRTRLGQPILPKLEIQHFLA